MARFENWLTRPGVIALGAFVVGAAVAGIVVAIVLTTGGDDGGSSAKTNTTPKASATPATVEPATPTPGRFTSPNDALAAFVQSQFGQTYVGPCSATSQAGSGICSIEKYRSAELATYFLGPPQSETLGEAVLMVNTDGAWNLTFVKAAPPGTPLVVGGQAVVYGAGDCLNFRVEPSATAAVTSCLPDGSQARATEGPVQADGKPWWKLEGYGWASAEFLQPAQQ